MKNRSLMFCQCIASQFNNSNIPNSPNKKSEKKKQVSILAKVSILSLSSVLSKLFKSNLAKSKYHQSKGMKPTKNNNSRNKQLYLSTNIKKIFKIKDLFSKLSLEKIEENHKTINKPRKKKLHINMTTKGPSKRQVIIPMGNDNISKFISSSGKHIANINRELKNIKLDVLADFVCTNYYRLIITTNKVTAMFSLNIIE